MRKFTVLAAAIAGISLSACPKHEEAPPAAHEDSTHTATPAPDAAAPAPDAVPAPAPGAKPDADPADETAPAGTGQSSGGDKI